MNNIKNIGGMEGLFHIFVPGLFLLFNFVGAVYFFPMTDKTSRDDMVSLFSNPTSCLILTISFGYLFGIILRILRCSNTDKLSAWVLRKTDKEARKPEGPNNFYAYENYPYTKWIGELTKRLPEETQEFYNCVWENRTSSTFINFCKILIISEDERSANEIDSAEAYNRYISGMFYALTISSILLIIVIISQICVMHNFNYTLTIVLLGYITSIFCILRNYRFMRLKEVQIIFSATYRYKKLFITTQNIEN